MDQTFTTAVNAQQTGEVFLSLLKIDSPELQTPVYYVNNNVAITSNGIVYYPRQFAFSGGGEKEKNIPNQTLTIDAVLDLNDPAPGGIAGIIQTMATATITQSFVLFSDLDTVQHGPFDLELIEARMGENEASFTVQMKDAGNKQGICFSFTPSTVPGVFA